MIKRKRKRAPKRRKIITLESGQTLYRDKLKKLRENAKTCWSVRSLPKPLQDQNVLPSAAYEMTAPHFGAPGTGRLEPDKLPQYIVYTPGHDYKYFPIGTLAFFIKSEDVTLTLPDLRKASSRQNTFFVVDDQYVIADVSRLKSLAYVESHEEEEEELEDDDDDEVP
jgi:hypothetical protein